MFDEVNIFLIILFLFQFAEAVPRLDPLVQTKLGLIRGLRASDGDYSMFLGIPYATVDAANPFGPAVPHPGFDETFEAYDDSAICPQVEVFNNTIVGSLDCLHLNIYVPNKASSQIPLPVMVWIYGGGFSIGFAGRYLYGPKYLVRHDVILVSINYRLGPYGFMCLDNPEVPGNQGLKDQLSALRWINANIGSFGGNPNEVTIFGESAGAMSVDFHLYSQQEQLFNNVIMQSGNAMVNFLIGEPDNTGPLKIAEYLGLETNDVTEAVSFLATADPHLVIAATIEAKVQFNVCVEKSFEGVENLVPSHTIVRDIPKAKKTKILIGFNSNERIFSYANQPDEYFENLDVVETTLAMYFNFDENTLSNVSDVVKHFYFGDDKMSENQKQAIADFASDMDFNHPTHRSIYRYLENDASSVYFYMFSYDGERNYVKKKNNINSEGAAHADEIGYLFDISYWKDNTLDSDQLLVDRMSVMWTNFAKYGNPTPEVTTLLPVTWKPVQKDTPFYYMNIDTEMKIETRPFKERMAFWDLFFQSFWSLQNGFTEDD